MCAGRPGRRRVVSEVGAERARPARYRGRACSPRSVVEEDRMTARLRRRVVMPLFLMAAVFMFPSAGYAQEATVTGTITDTTGGVLPGVTIKIGRASCRERV